MTLYTGSSFSPNSALKFDWPKKYQPMIVEKAKKNMHTVTLTGTTIPHEVLGAFGAGRVLMKPAAPGTGVIAGGPVRIIMEAAGIKDIRTKCLRSNTAVNVVAATFEGLKALRTPEEVARTRGKSVDEIVG